MPDSSETATAADKPAPVTGRYGSRSLTLLVVASMIGSGVFTTSGFTLGAVGSPARVMLCWLIAGGIAVCGAVAYGQLARLMPESGGEYLYLSRNVHPFAGFLAGWVSLTAGFSGAIAFAAVAFEQYAFPATIRPLWLPPDVISIAMILLCAAAHGWNAAWGKNLQNIVVILKLSVLCCFIGFAAYQIPHHSWHRNTLQDAPATGLPLLTAMATSLVWISLSYAGFNAAIYVAAESPEASRNVPRALWRGTALVTLLYLALNAIFITSVPGPDMAWQESVAAISAAALGGQPLEICIRIAVCLGLFSSVSGMIMTGPRVYSKMADDGVFPKMFSVPQGGIRKSVAFQATISIGLILMQRILVNAELLKSSLLGLLIYLSTTLSISSALCALTLFLPRIRRQIVEKHIAHDAATLVYAVSTLAAVGLMIGFHKVDGQSQSLEHIGGVMLTIITGTLAWTSMRRRRRSKTPDLS